MQAEEREYPLLWLSIALLSAVLLALTLLGLHTHYMDASLLFFALLLLARFLVVLLREYRISVDLLMGVAGLVAWRLHLLTEGLLIFLLYALSELLEEWAERYSKRKLTGLRELLPERVPVEADGRTVLKRLEDLRPGDIVVLRRGDVVPADGIVVGGPGLFDTSFVTGESEPVLVEPGERVASGYINVDGVARVRVLVEPSKSLLQLLVAEAERALERKSRLERMVDRFSQPYTLLVLGVYGAASLAATPLQALPILLAGCPSAFIVSSSTATALAIALLARRSLVVRGGRVLEAAASARVAVLDKTGTLSLGEMRLVSVEPAPGWDADTVLRLAAAAAKASMHPVSRSLHGVESPEPLEAVEHPGLGVEAVVGDAGVLIGSRGFLEQRGVKGLPQEERCHGLRELLVAVNNAYAGSICLEETVSREAVEAVAQLRSMGLRLVIASGDKPERVRRVAEIVGAHEWHAELSPKDKRRLVETLRATHGPVLFVGDGVNDAEAMAVADVGVAVGSIRLVTSIADAVSLKGVVSLPLLLRASRSYVSSVRYSILGAAAVKLSTMLLGLAGLIPLWATVALGDDGSTLLALAVIAAMLRASTEAWHGRRQRPAQFKAGSRPARRPQGARVPGS